MKRMQCVKEGEEKSQCMNWWNEEQNLVVVETILALGAIRLSLNSAVFSFSDIPIANIAGYKDLYLYSEDVWLLFSESYKNALSH